VLVQTVTTVNFRAGWFGRLLCSGVDYQLEHHLFPGICHTYYPQVSPLLKRYCEERGYPYRTLGWWEAIWKSLIAFKHPRGVAPTVESSRIEGARVVAPAAVRASKVLPCVRTSVRVRPSHRRVASLTAIRRHTASMTLPPSIRRIAPDCQSCQHRCTA
jgi:hypothetical protein